MKKLVNLTLIATISFVMFACSSISNYFDRDKEYLESKALPTLEVPPDLTVRQSEDMLIPGENDPSSLNEFERQRSLAYQSNVPTPSTTTAFSYGDELITLSGSVLDNWPKLIDFWTSQGFDIDLNDPELGVLETEWKFIDNTNNELRKRYSVFAEPNRANNTDIVIHSEMQKKTENVWYNSTNDYDGNKKIGELLKSHFHEN